MRIGEESICCRQVVDDSDNMRVFPSIARRFYMVHRRSGTKVQRERKFLVSKFFQRRNSPMTTTGQILESTINNRINISTSESKACRPHTYRCKCLIDDFRVAYYPIFIVDCVQTLKLLCQIKNPSLSTDLRSDQ